MIVAQSGQVVMFDVDGTLVTDKDLSSLNECLIPYFSGTQRRHLLSKNINLLVDMSIRGRYVVVWSQGGWQWAEAVVKALGLEQYVNLIIEKPIAYVDDLDVQNYFPPRIFLND